MAKKAKKKAKKNTSRARASRSTKKKSTRPRGKNTSKAKRSHAKHSKKKARKSPNPTTQLRRKIAAMAPNKWYDTTLSGAKIRVKRSGKTLTMKTR